MLRIGNDLLERVFSEVYHLIGVGIQRWTLVEFLCIVVAYKAIILRYIIFHNLA